MATKTTASALRKLECHGRFKQRSHDTHMERDLPWLMNKNKPVEVVFLGDSHLERMLWFDHGKLRAQLPKNAMVAAVGGDHIANVLYRMESPAGILFHLFKRQQTKKLIFWAGSNDVLVRARKQQSNDDDAEYDAPKKKPVRVNLDRVVNQMRDVIDTIRTYLPQVQIEVWALPQDMSKHPDVDTFNQKLASLCFQSKVQFNDSVYQATRLSSDLWLEDGHLNAKGYYQCVVPAVLAAAKV